MLVLVCYDVSLISENGQQRLRRVAKICADYGIRVQNSVFECVVDQAQFLILKDRLLKVIDKKNGGHGSGVNAGLKVACGRYFKVVDANN